MKPIAIVRQERDGTWSYSRSPDGVGLENIAEGEGYETPGEAVRAARAAGYQIPRANEARVLPHCLHVYVAQEADVSTPAARQYAAHRYGLPLERVRVQRIPAYLIDQDITATSRITYDCWAPDIDGRDPYVRVTWMDVYG